MVQIAAGDGSDGSQATEMVMVAMVAVMDGHERSFALAPWSILPRPYISFIGHYTKLHPIWLPFLDDWRFLVKNKPLYSLHA